MTKVWRGKMASKGSQVRSHEYKIEPILLSNTQSDYILKILYLFIQVDDHFWVLQHQ